MYYKTYQNRIMLAWGQINIPLQYKDESRNRLTIAEKTSEGLGVKTYHIIFKVTGGL